MSRDLTSELAAAFLAVRVEPVILVNLEFNSGWVYLWTGIGTVVWNGNTYYGVILPGGTVLGKISALAETTDLEAQSVSLSLSGVPPDVIQDAIADCQVGLGAKIFLGAFDPSSGTILPDPFCAWGGFTDIPAITDDGRTATVSITVESRLVDLQRSTQWRYTHQDQQLFSAGDLGFIFVGSLQTANITWGQGVAAGPVAAAPVPADSGWRGVAP
jgi:hypothetical protein